jgi:hypothetical protein
MHDMHANTHAYTYSNNNCSLREHPQVTPRSTSSMLKFDLGFNALLYNYKSKGLVPQASGNHCMQVGLQQQFGLSRAWNIPKLVSVWLISSSLLINWQDLFRVMLWQVTVQFGKLCKYTVLHSKVSNWIRMHMNHYNPLFECITNFGKTKMRTSYRCTKP